MAYDAMVSNGGMGWVEMTETDSGCIGYWGSPSASGSSYYVAVPLASPWVTKPIMKATRNRTRLALTSAEMFRLPVLGHRVVTPVVTARPREVRSSPTEQPRFGDRTTNMVTALLSVWLRVSTEVDMTFDPLKGSMVR